MVWLSRAMEHGAPALERAVRTSLAAWHGRARMLERTLPQPGEVRALWFSPDGKRLAAADREGVVVLWDVASGTHLGDPLDHPGRVSALAFSADGRRIVTGCDDGAVRRWDGVTGEPAGPPADLGAAVLGLCPCGEGFLAVSGVATALIRHDGEPQADPAPAGCRLSAAAVSNDGAFLAAVTEDGDVWLYDPSARSWSARPRPHARGASALVFHPRDGRLLVRCLDGVARLCDREGDSAGALEFADFEETAWSGFSPTGETVATISASGDVQLWDAASGAAVGEPLPHRSRLAEVAFHPDGSLLATGCRDGSARLWDAATGLAVGPPLDHGGAVEVLAFSPDGRRLAAGCADGRLRFWKTPAPLPGDVERVCCWVRVDAELDIDAADAIRPLDALAGWELRRRLYELGGPPLK
jgi:WD40 repeat protein